MTDHLRHRDDWCLHRRAGGLGIRIETAAAAATDVTPDWLATTRCSDDPRGDRHLTPLKTREI